MVHPFRSALLVIAALSAATVAPAQVRPGMTTEPLLSGMNQMPAQVNPAALATPELPAATDALAPADGIADGALVEVLGKDERRLATGFWEARDQDVLRPYVVRYFTDVPALTGRVGEDALATVAALAYPSHVVEASTADKSASALQRNDLTASVRRASSATSPSTVTPVTRPSP